MTPDFPTYFALAAIAAWLIVAAVCLLPLALAIVFGAVAPVGRLVGKLLRPRLQNAPAVAAGSITLTLPEDLDRGSRGATINSRVVARKGRSSHRLRKGIANKLCCVGLACALLLMWWTDRESKPWIAFLGVDE